MKRMLALLMTIALAVSAVAVTAFAGETDEVPDQITSATTQTGKGFHGNRQQTPGNGQNPQGPGNTGNGQAPQMPGQDSQNNEQPGMPGKGGRNLRQGNRFGTQDNAAADVWVKHGRHVDLDQLLADGVITQEVYDTIVNYLNEKAQQQPGAAAPAEGTDSSPAAEEEQESAELKLLKQLLDSGVITQEQYDLLAAQYTAAGSAGSI